MKRELKFFIDLFIECNSGKSKLQQKCEVAKLIKGIYKTNIGEQFQYTIVKTNQGKYKFSYIDINNRETITTTTSSIDEIRIAFDFLLSF